MKQLLIIAHTPSLNTEAMLSAVLKGAKKDAGQAVNIQFLNPLEAGPDDVINADAIILATTENLGYMSGLLKDFFDRIYYPCLEKTDAMPCAILIRAGMDGTGTNRALDSILTGLRWQQVQPPLICRGDWQEEFLFQCEELGQYVSISLEAGLI